MSQIKIFSLSFHITCHTSKNIHIILYKVLTKLTNYILKIKNKSKNKISKLNWLMVYILFFINPEIIIFEDIGTDSRIENVQDVVHKKTMKIQFQIASIVWLLR